MTRNLLENTGLSRFISKRTIALIITLSLTSLTSQGAFALSPCAISPTDASCSIDAPKSYQLVVNKTRPIAPKTYIPSDLIKVPKFNPYGRILRKAAASAVVKLGNAMLAAKQGTLIVQSGYRSYASQKTIHAAKVKALGKVKGERLAARPGFSEHQTGLAVDFAAKGVSTLTVSFAKTKAGIWLAANAYKFGFVLRYPAGKTAITGYQYEPWHFRFVGVDLATVMHDQGIQTLEEYFSLSAAPNYLN